MKTITIILLSALLFSCAPRLILVNGDCYVNNYSNPQNVDTLIANIRSKHNIPGDIIVIDSVFTTRHTATDTGNIYECKQSIYSEGHKTPQHDE